MKNLYGRVATILILLLLFATGGPGPIPSFAEPLPRPDQSLSQSAPTLPQPPGVSAESAIVIDQTTGTILYDKNSRQKAYPASTTKIVTALLAMESASLDRQVKVPGAAVGVEGSSIYLAAGEQLTLRDLVYGLMLRSGNDAAAAISCLVAPSSEEFVRRMNQRVRAMGAMDTNYTNPSGLFDENHYTTAYDMAIIAREAMKNPEFREIVGSKSWVADRGEGKYNHFYNKNKVVFQYPGGTGIKIGYTKKSGRTLAASSSRNGMELVCVVMNAPDWFNDSYKLMDYVYQNFEMIKIADGQKKLKAIPVLAGDKDHVFIGPAESIVFPVPKGQNATLEVTYRIPAKVRPPVGRWQKAGSFELRSAGEILASYPLYFLEDIDPAAVKNR